MGAELTASDLLMRCGYLCRGVTACETLDACDRDYILSLVCHITQRLHENIESPSRNVRAEFEEIRRLGLRDGDGNDRRQRRRDWLRVMKNKET